MNFTDVIYLLQDVFEFSFKLLKPIGNAGNWAFGLVIAAGVAYWSYNEAKVEHPKEDFDKQQEYIS